MWKKVMSHSSACSQSFNEITWDLVTEMAMQAGVNFTHSWNTYIPNHFQDLKDGLRLKVLYFKMMTKTQEWLVWQKGFE